MFVKNDHVSYKIFHRKVKSFIHKREREQSAVVKQVYFTTNSPAIHFSKNNHFKTKNTTEAIRSLLCSDLSGDPHTRRDCYVFFRRFSTDANSLSKPHHKRSWHCSSHTPPNCFLREFSEQQMDAISIRQLLFSFTNLLTLSPHFSPISFPLLSFFVNKVKSSGKNIFKIMLCYF
jgi:hypothetical protein